MAGGLKCLFCSSLKFIKNGKTIAGSQRYFCKVCKKSFVIDGARTTYTGDIKKHVKIDLFNGMGIRGVSRKYGISTNTVYGWIS